MLQELDCKQENVAVLIERFWINTNLGSAQLSKHEGIHFSWLFVDTWRCDFGWKKQQPGGGLECHLRFYNLQGVLCLIKAILSF